MTVFMEPITVEHLETMLEVPIMCEYLGDRDDDCTNMAVWVVHMHHHCATDISTHIMFCDPCLASLKSGDQWYCDDCSAWDKAIDYVLSITRI